MKLVIDIDEDVRVAISRIGLLRVPDEMQKKVDMAIQHGTPLPKGYGDLIDRDKLNKIKKYLFKTDNGAFPKSEWFIKVDDLFSEKAIIEADKEQEE